MSDEEIDPKTVSRILVCVSVALYVFGLFEPAFKHDRGVVSGWEALGEGWFPAIFYLFAIPGTLIHDGIGGLFSVIPNFCWFANPGLWMTWLVVLFGSHQLGKIFSCATCVTGLLFLFLNSIAVPDGQSMLHIQSGFGCMLWYGSMVAALFASVAREPSTLNSTTPGAHGTLDQTGSGNEAAP